MTADEVRRCYQIPLKIIQEYEHWRHGKIPLKCEEAVQYQDQDIAYLSIIVTLHDIGFQKSEVESYMQLLMKGADTQEKRLQILNEKRNETLQEIHKKEAQLDKLDYLRFQVKNVV